MAGYSGTPLAKKLGFKSGHRVRISGAPANYLQLVNPRPDGVMISDRLRKDIDIWHFFSKSESALVTALPRMKSAIRKDGMIWVSWPKQASKAPTNITEDVVRRHALPLGLVDVKVCAVDDVWSGLKLVIRKELRK
jgi:hypothetical protein